MIMQNQHLSISQVNISQSNTFSMKVFIGIVSLSFIITMSLQFSSNGDMIDIGSNLYSLDSNGNNEPRSLLTNDMKSYNIKETIKLKGKDYILNKLLSKIYEGSWITTDYKFRIGQKQSGKMNLKFLNAKELISKKKSLAVLFKMHEDQYINHWININAFLSLDHITIRETGNNEIGIFGTFHSELIKGEFFNIKPYSLEKFDANITIYFSVMENEEEGNNGFLLDSTSFKLYLKTAFGYSAIIEGHEITHISLMKYTTYSIIISIISILSSFATYLVTKRLKENEHYNNALSTLTIVQSMIWNSYSFVNHLFFGFKHPNLLYHFMIPSALHLLGFVAFDLRLITVFWQIKKRVLSNEQFTKQKVQFYLFFYFLFFLSLLGINKCFYNEWYILILSLSIWIPQIFYNMKEYNTLSLPLLYVICITLDRLFISFYFKALPNCFSIAPNLMFMSIIFVLMIIMIGVMYMQGIYGPRWMLPLNFKKKPFDYYKTEKELGSKKKNYKSLECVICLCLLSETETKKGNTIKYEETLLDKTSDFVIKPPLSEFKDESIYKPNYYRRMIKFMFDFTEPTKNHNNKKFMITPCDHVFHTECLEEWFLQKKECPHCRTIMVD